MKKALGKSTRIPDVTASELGTASQALLCGWTLAVLYALSQHPQRFNELKAKLPDVPPRSIARILKRLEVNGIVVRRVSPTRSPAVFYSIPAGSKVYEIAAAFHNWASREFSKH